MHTYTANLARSNKRKYLAAYFEARDAWNSLPALLSLSLLGSASVLELTEHKIIIRNQISAEIWTPSQFEADQAQLPLLFPCETPWLPTAALGVVIKRKIEKQRAKKLRMGKCEQQAKGESQVKNYVISRARKKVCNAFWFSCQSDAHKLVGRGSPEWWWGGETMWPTLSIMFMTLPQNNPHPSTCDLCKWSPREHFHNSQTTHTICEGIYKNKE